MSEKYTFAQTRRIMLLRSIYVLVMPVMLIFAALACGTAVTELASYICPTRIPPTAGPQPTYLPGTPIPTATPIPPPPTPYRIEPPQDFYRGDAIFVGQPGSATRLRFQLQSVQARPASSEGSSRNLYSWSLEIKNLGTANYETIPIAQMYLSLIITPTGEAAGIWRTSEAAMQAAGITGQNYDAIQPGATRVYRLAAYGPVGNARRLTFVLDDESSNQITWINQANPYCSGDIAD